VVDAYAPGKAGQRPTPSGTLVSYKEATVPRAVSDRFNGRPAGAARHSPPRCLGLSRRGCHVRVRKQPPGGRECYAWHALKHDRSTAGADPCRQGDADECCGGCGWRGDGVKVAGMPLPESIRQGAEADDRQSRVRKAPWPGSP